MAAEVIPPWGPERRRQLTDGTGRPFGRHPPGVAVEAEPTFGGVTIPAELRAGWWWGTERQVDGEFFRARITDVAFG